MHDAFREVAFSGGAIRIHSEDGRLARAERVAGGRVTATYEHWPFSPGFALDLAARPGGGDLLAVDLERHRFVGFRTAFMVDRFGLAEARPQRVLDFGCGSGLSTYALAGALDPPEIVAADLNADYLDIFRARLAAAPAPAIRIVGMGDGVDLARVEGDFDLVQLNAVFEHLLPPERPALMRALWRRLRPGGLLLLTETPWRWFPVETHTTSLPLVNYLPDALALRAARWSRRIAADASWEKALREGLRGATLAEILTAIGEPRAEPVPGRAADARDLLEVWWHGECRRTRAKEMAYRALSALRGATGLAISPWLNLVLRKPA